MPHRNPCAGCISKLIVAAIGWLTVSLPPAAADWNDRDVAANIVLPQARIESVLAAQAGMIRDSLAGLARQRPGVRDTYFVSVAGFAGDAVFRKEAMSARELFDQHFDTAGRSLVLANNVDTVDKLPLASAFNLGRVLDGIGRIIDRNEDVVVVFLSSHGLPNLLSLRFDGFPIVDIGPTELASQLKEAKIGARVLILSACFSGSFIGKLTAAEALVITAAREDRTSFGCDSGRDWTFFGDAFFNHALRRTRELDRGYAAARTEISGWESKDQLTPSEPQLKAGGAIIPILQAMGLWSKS